MKAIKRYNRTDSFMQKSKPKVHPTCNYFKLQKSCILRGNHFAMEQCEASSQEIRIPVTCRIESIRCGAEVLGWEAFTVSLLSKAIPCGLIALLWSQQQIISVHNDMLIARTNQSWHLPRRMYEVYCCVGRDFIGFILMNWLNGIKMAINSKSSVFTSKKSQLQRQMSPRELVSQGLC